MKMLYSFVITTCVAFTLSAQLNINLLSHYTYPDHLSNIWGYVDSLGNEYALVGESSGLSIVNVTDPVNPIQVHFESDVNSAWRELKAWKKHAFVVTEGGGGMMIVDMTNLPLSASLVGHYQGNNFSFSSAHTISVDENGVAYIFGSNYSYGGAIMLDLNDPQNPVELGVVDEYYIHDGFVRGDTLWASCIYDGLEVVYDVSNKANPVKLAEFATPHNFTHNSWLSDDGHYLYTTDEVSGAFVAAYDVSDLSNVVEVDRFQSNPGTGVIPHNTYFLNNYLVTSYYRDGVVIVDASRPHNLIEVGNYDTAPGLSGDGFNADWGVYPFLPSGNLILSDIESGLFVLGPNYQRACYLEGMVTDSLCGATIDHVKVKIIGTNVEDYSNLSGNFATGYAISGTYTIEFSKPGYQTKTISGVTLTNGVLTSLNVQMSSSSLVNLTGQIQDFYTHSGIEGVQVVFKNSSNTFTYTTDANGNFDQCNFILGFYDVYVGKWGYANICQENVLVSGTSYNYTQSVKPEYQDNFNLNLGWTVSSTATSGRWERGIPVGTSDGTHDINPGLDDDLDCGDYAFVTGNDGGNTWTDDVDNGATILISSEMNINAWYLPYLEYSYWYATIPGSFPSPFNDYLKVKLTNGVDTVIIAQYDTATTMFAWEHHKQSINGLLDYTMPVKILVEVRDVDPGHILEGAFDHFRLYDSLQTKVTEFVNQELELFPNPSSGELVLKKGNFDIREIVVTDITGRDIRRIKPQTQGDVIRLNMNIDGGMYIIRVLDGYGQNIIEKTWIKL